MAASDIVARVVALIGGAAILMRRQAPGSETPAVGAAPAIPDARPQAIPTLKMPTARGWSGGRTPVAAPGLKVNAFATGLKHPRWIEVLPNGDVLAAEALMTPGGIRTAFDYAIHATLKRAAAVGASPNRITRLRDADGDGVAEERGTFLDGLNQPFGMALVDGTFYVGNTDGVVAFPYEDGAPRITAPGRPVAALEPGGHWTRSLIPSPDGRRLYAGVGSLTNIGDHGLAAEEGRAAIWEIDLDTGAARVFASGLRNPVGLAWEPLRHALDRGQRARRPRRRDPTRLPHLGPRRRLLRLALLLLGPDRRHPRAPEPGDGRQRHPARLRPRRPHRLARPLLAAGRHPARLPRRHGRSASTAPGTAASSAATG